MKKNKAGRFAFLLVTAMALTGCSGKNRPDYTAEAMNVGGVSVPLGEVNFYLRYQQIQMQGFSAYFGEDFMNQDLMGMGTPYGETIRDTAVETLKEYYVVEAHAKELGVTLSEEEKGRIQEAAKAFLEANDSKALKAMSADETTVSHVLSLMTLQNKVYDDRAATIDTEVDPDLVAQKRVGYVMSSLAGTTDEEGNVTELTEEERGEKKTQMEALLAAGLKEFQVSVGQIEYFKGICQQAGLGEETESELRELISGKNIFGAEALLAGKGVEESHSRMLLKVTEHFGSVQVLKSARELAGNPRSLAAVDRLEKLYHVLCEYGVEKYISFDLGMLSKYHYYTGVIFKVYTYGVGEPVAAMTSF